ncbi:MAG: hypothetical protein SH848_07585 [Saprospiraceae bacterium]|nr:hypothetical protein [Saprospiraceae bacterium]MDZ4703775.1 hypothetical protein [Saprospiraceae bacterium]
MAALSLIFSHVCAQETPPGDARYRANIGLHYNLPLRYASGSEALGFYRKPESLVGILTPSLSLPAGAPVVARCQFFDSCVQPFRRHPVLPQYRAD